MTFPGSCPRCAESGAPSKIFAVLSPPGNYDEFGDEEGHLHRRYKAASSATYRSPIGHEWTEPWQRRCAVRGCGWRSPLSRAESV
jgi:hypothetical protein